MTFPAASRPILTPRSPAMYPPSAKPFRQCFTVASFVLDGDVRSPTVLRGRRHQPDNHAPVGQHFPPVGVTDGGAVPDQHHCVPTAISSLLRSRRFRGAVTRPDTPRNGQRIGTSSSRSS